MSTANFKTDLKKKKEPSLEQNWAFIGVFNHDFFQIKIIKINPSVAKSISKMYVIHCLPDEDLGFYFIFKLGSLLRKAQRFELHHDIANITRRSISESKKKQTIIYIFSLQAELTIVR